MIKKLVRRVILWAVPEAGGEVRPSQEIAAQVQKSEVAQQLIRDLNREARLNSRSL